MTEPFAESPSEVLLNCPADKHFASGNTELSRPGVRDETGGFRVTWRIRCLSCGATRDYHELPE